MISVLVIRRFNVRTNGTARVVAAARLLDLPALPLHGYVLAFEDGSGEAGVAAMRMHAWPSPRATGIYSAGVEIRMGAEPGERYEPAVAAGWQPLEVAP